MTVLTLPNESTATGVEQIQPNRHGRFDLEFNRHGPCTRLGTQFVSYPLHMTRPFSLDVAIPSLLTVYQQSASGGIYRGDRLSSEIAVGPAAAAHITTQAATMVHDCHGDPAWQDVTIRVGPDAYFASTPDAMVLFPGAFARTAIRVRLGAGAAAFLADSFTHYDPAGTARPFDRILSETIVAAADGTMTVRDRYEVAGRHLMQAASPMGRWRVYAGFLFLGDPERLPSKERIAEVADIAGAVTGVSMLPNGAGLNVRCLATDAVAARMVSNRLFEHSIEAAFGVLPAARRK